MEFKNSFLTMYKQVPLLFNFFIYMGLFMGSVFFLIGILTAIYIDFPSFSTAFTIAGLLQLVLWGILLYFIKKEKRRIKKLKKNGKLIYCNDISVEYKTNIIINGVCPSVIYCSYDFGNGNDGLFESDVIKKSPEDINKACLTNIPVYVDMDDYDNYLVDMDYINNKLNIRK